MPPRRSQPVAKKARTGPAPRQSQPVAKKTRTGPAPMRLGPCAVVADGSFSMQLGSGVHDKASAGDINALTQQVFLGVRLTARVVMQSGVVVDVVLQRAMFRPRSKEATVDGIRLSVHILAVSVRCDSSRDSNYNR
jgi:hypothetical protein